MPIEKTETKEVETKPLEVPPIRRRSIFAISDDLLALDDLIAELGGDISDPKVAEAIDAWFSELGSEMEEKLDNYAALISEYEGRVQVLRLEEDRITQRRIMAEARAKRLKDRLLMFMEQRGIKNVQTRRYNLTMAANGGEQRLLINHPVPDYYQREIKHKVPDKEKIRADLEAGVQMDFAELEPRGKHLRIS